MSIECFEIKIFLGQYFENVALKRAQTTRLKLELRVDSHIVYKKLKEA